ncbi:MAG: monooxygenase [Motilibacteraceae bacterium]
MSGVPGLVTLHLWRVAPRDVPRAVLRMAADRRPVRRAPGARFAKLLGTGDGRTFTVRDADPLHWGLLVAWETAQDAVVFEGSRTVRQWGRIAQETLRLDLVPLSSHGRWARQEPFGRPSPQRWDGPVAALTRARIAPRKAVTFWRAVPPVSADLHRSEGVRLAVGVGEAPIGLQGTFSVWASGKDLTEFAHRRGPHVEAIRRTAEERWYSEELFARLAVVGGAGSFCGTAATALAEPA